MKHSYSIHHLLIAVLAIVASVPVAAQTPFWQSTRGAYGGNVTSMAADPAGRLYVAVSSRGVFRSDDNGGDWRKVNNGLPGRMIGSIVCDRRGYLYTECWENGIYRSTNQGEEWTRMEVQPASGAAYALLVSHDDHIFAGMSDGLYKSTDGGDSWNRMENIFAGQYVFSLGLDSAGTLYAGSEGPMMRSSDGGANWEPLGEMFGERSWVNFLVTPAGTILAPHTGIYRFTYADPTWRLQSPEIEMGGFTRVFLAPNGDLIATSMREFPFEWKLWRSTDDGISWQLQGTDTLRPAASLIVGDRLFFGTGRGVFRSADNGHLWEEANKHLAGTGGHKIAVSRNGTILTYGTRNMHRSTDDGENWTVSNDPMWSPGVRHMISCTDGSLIAVVNRRLLRSIDDGVTWNDMPVIEDLPTFWSMAVGTGGDILASSDSGLHRSSDHGVTWTLMNQLKEPIESVEFGPQGRIFAVAREGVYRSTDNGGSWTKVYTGANLSGIVVTSYGRVAVGGSRGSLSYGPIYVSDDFGDTWTTIALIQSRLRTFGLDADGNILAGTEENGPVYGPYILRKGSNAWESLSSGFEMQAGSAIVLSPRGYLVIGGGTGIYRSVLPAASAESRKAPDASLLLENIPNPFSDITRIRFTITKPGPVALDVVDLLGRPVRHVLAEWREKGEHEVEIDANRLAPGSYRCILTSGAERVATMMVVVR